MTPTTIIGLIPLLALPALAENLIISNNATDAKHIRNSIVSPTGALSASGVSSTMNDLLFVKRTPEGAEAYGNAGSLTSVACSTVSAADFRYTLNWTAQINTAEGYTSFAMNKMTVDWALLRLHLNTVDGIVSTYDGEGVRRAYDLSFHYELSSADGAHTWKSDPNAPITVTIGGIAERDPYMCSNSGNIYRDAVHFTEAPETIMSAAQSEINFATPVELFDDMGYSLTLTLAGVYEHDTGLPFALNNGVTTPYALGTAQEFTYAAVGNIAFSGGVGPQPTPEPATATLGLLALGGLLSRRRRS